MFTLDAYAKAPEDIRVLYKQIQKCPTNEVEGHSSVIDFNNDSSIRDFHLSRTIDTSTIAFSSSATDEFRDTSSELVNVYESAIIPGLLIIPSLISPTVQRELVDRMLHRDLADPRHQTNLHKFYSIPYELSTGGDEKTNDESQRSFFYANPKSTTAFSPLDPTIHKPLDISRVLNRKLRWITLGGQYDWTNKVYPDAEHPQFPPDLAHITQKAFPAMKPQAAIINVYTPGDTLSLHRDVSEESEEGLVSISIGNEAIFVVGLADEGTDTDRRLAIRLRSGDALYMSGSARYAWHGVPLIIAGSCPEHLESWPARSELPSLEMSTSGSFESWRGWMRNKRINFNIRQMTP